MTQRGDIITNIELIDPYTEVLQAHKKLNEEVELMNSKINDKIQKNQSEFLVAYQNHLRKIKIQLSDLRGKFDNYETEMNKNERAMMLEKQIILFRQQALKLYDRLEQKTQQAQIYKNKSKQQQKSLFIFEKQAKQQTKQRKFLQSKLLAAEIRIGQLQKQIKCKNQTPNKTKYFHEIEGRTRSMFTNNNLSLRLKDPQTRQVTPSKTNTLGLRRKSMNGSNGFTNNKDDGELKNWFLQCVRTIKKDVAQRKNTNQQINFDYIKNIDEFKMVDKLRLLQRFMQNEKLLTWMYEKIFPSKTNEVKQYLLKGKTEPTSKIIVASQSIKKGNNYSQQILPQSQYLDAFGQERDQRAHTKLTQLKNRRNQIRNKVIMKDGRLNLSYL